MRTANHLAVVCLSFGAALVVFGSGTLGQRIGNLFFFGLIPAVGVYAGGQILGQALVLGVQLCDMIMARCFWYGARLVNDLLRWAGTYVLAWGVRGNESVGIDTRRTFSQPRSWFQISRDRLMKVKFHANHAHDSKLGSSNDDELWIHGS
jgi:hypothetical protein